MNAKRQIRGTEYNVAEMVQNAIAAADSQVLNLEKARQSLAYIGNRNPTEEQVTRYAREFAILNKLAQATGAYGFENQIGKIDFSSTEKAVSDVNAYLSRRNQAHRSRWTTSHRGY
jgi:hypothetical protein